MNQFRFNCTNYIQLQLSPYAEEEARPRCVKASGPGECEKILVLATEQHPTNYGQEPGSSSGPFLYTRQNQPDEPDDYSRAGLISTLTGSLVTLISASGKLHSWPSELRDPAVPSAPETRLRSCV